jgi:peptide/nickel transport system permease protein
MIVRLMARRLLGLVFTGLGITLLVFLMSHVIPADPALLAAGRYAHPEQIARIREEYGLDQPIFVQYLRYLLRLSRGDLGISIRTHRPVIQDLGQRVSATLELSLAAEILVVAIGIPLGVIAATQKDRWGDHIGRLVSIVGVSLPIFWLGLVLQLLFYGKLAILPIVGRLDTLVDPPTRITGLYLLDSLVTRNWQALASASRHIVLPAFGLSFPGISIVARMVRSSLLEVLRQPYMTVARAKGLGQRSVVFGHALRNALIPVITVLALQMGSLLAGAVLIETIFAWPGVGFYAVASVQAMDYQPIMGVTLLVAVGYALANLVADVLYVVVDPRVSYR